MVLGLGPVILMVAERTTYFSSVGWAWALAAILTPAWKLTSEGGLWRRRWVATALVAAVLAANLVGLVHRSYWWERVANVSRDLSSRVQRALLDLPAGGDSQLWFINLPYQIEYAYAFGNRTLFAVWLLQKELGVEAETLVIEGADVGASLREYVAQLLSERSAEGPVVVFYWREGALIEFRVPDDPFLPSQEGARAKSEQSVPRGSLSRVPCRCLARAV